MLLVLATLAASPPPGVAQERPRTASPDELWRDYPLEPKAGSDSAARSGGTSSAPEPRPARPAPKAPDDAGSETGMIVLLVLLAIPLAALTVLLVPWGRLRRPGSPAGARRGHASPARPWTELRRSAWTAEIRWRGDAGPTRFGMLASSPDGDSVILAESPDLEWPPDDATAMAAVVDAVERLERQVLAAGWAPAEPGHAWFERRFVWPRTDRPPDRRLRGQGTRTAGRT